MQVHLIAAARPNFMKIAPLYHALKKEAWAVPVIVHTGQHYDLNMSDAFFTDLKMPAPHIYLNVGSGSHAEQTGKVMIAYEKVLLDKKPDLVIVVGDVNSTLACTLAAVKVNYQTNSTNKPNLPTSTNITNATNQNICNQSAMSHGQPRPYVAHLEAGLRSFDRTMPEEINRIATDALADVLWTPSPDGDENLLKEGVDKNKIERVGNIMIDSLEMMREKIENEKVFVDYGMEKGQYGVVTFHRPANVDTIEMLKSLCNSLISISMHVPLVFPIHPRTRKNLQNFGLLPILEKRNNIILTEPLSYVRFMNLILYCRLAITDSGGIQEETTYLNIPCLTVRPNTERPITITRGTNLLSTLEEIQVNAERILSKEKHNYQPPDLWDGHSAGRIVASIKKRWG